ncbi:MYXO-CTERM sorting domain-containing protein [Pseudenhygromyxa sp. WMMC2535]|uniref:MYXO-CTERM sorting domain-containing protein n=1 Tax=Pseudenhygromyxa sp. WMMC2535 TaxID=2712867 RepID=UPI001554BE83|nr:MYXO-CTERM sorting domain-containing protein [Pseudenhygromyxa sp. WMMC2535]NVB36633.1 MYXO-CTERM sorting domain-containing protein [Pseudenhygromyxa sp. WMMC2535]
MSGRRGQAAALTPRLTVQATAVVAGVTLLGAPRLAQAGNETHPRTPVAWTEVPCMRVVDRSQSPLIAFDYTIPFEDTEVTPDEVSDSRTHQFFAFCRDRHPEDILPGWITEADVTAADAKGLGDLDSVDLELYVLENNAEWADCWSRITTDAQRRAITFAAASEPVAWDTMALPAGSYVVDGYTYEPWYNLWTPRPGVFKIVDDPDPAASGPAAALTFGEQAVGVGEAATLTGCVDAMAGSTMSLAWSKGGVGSDPTWAVFASELAAETGSFELAFEPPAEAAASSVMIRLEISDPMGRSWTAFGHDYIAVVDVGDSGCEEGGSFVSTPCDTETGEESGAGSEGGLDVGESEATGADQGEVADAGAEGASEGGGSGCACASADEPGGSGAALGLALLALLGLRRRQVQLSQ